MKRETCLSFVATSRNDDHGGNLLGRMQVFLDGLIAQCERHDLDGELVLVEWNPPPERPRLIEALRWPKVSKHCAVRIIEVPQEVHRRFRYSEHLPLFQMIAKNAAIRRSRGTFVLATNIDILFPDELMKFMASRRLKKGRMYRVNRHDVPMPEGDTLESQFRFCCEHVIRICEREGTRNLLTGHPHVIYNPLNWKQRLREELVDWGLLRATTRSRLHTNACGDFTLMSREDWFSLRGYPELEMYSFHLDSVLCHSAHHGGAREQFLREPMRIYHIDHSVGSGWTPEGKEVLNSRLADKGIPQLPHSQMVEWAVQMRQERKPLLLNKESWGLADEELAETVIYE